VTASDRALGIRPFGRERTRESGHEPGPRLAQHPLQFDVGVLAVLHGAEQLHHELPAVGKGDHDRGVGLLAAQHRGSPRLARDAHRAEQRRGECGLAEDPGFAAVGRVRRQPHRPCRVRVVGGEAQREASADRDLGQHARRHGSSLGDIAGATGDFQPTSEPGCRWSRGR
jgi:hypothetical protein